MVKSEKYVQQKGRIRYDCVMLADICGMKPKWLLYEQKKNVR